MVPQRQSLEMGLFIGRPSLPGNPRVKQLPAPFPEAQLAMWILAWPPQPVDALLPFSASNPPGPRTLAVRPLSWLMGDWRGLSSSSNQPGGMQHFPTAREPNWGPYPLGSLLTQGLGSTERFLQRPLNRGLLLLQQAPSMGGWQWPPGHSQ